MAATRGVAMKSTTLNGRPSLAASRTPNNQLNHSNGSHNHKNGGGAMTHPAPLPTTTIIASNPAWKAMPPKPTLDIKRVLNGKKHSFFSFSIYIIVINVFNFIN
jgi:hypothetical protein